MTDLTMHSEALLRAIPGFLVAAVIATLARRAGSLSRSGALAAIVTGTLCVAAGTKWGVLLIVYFVAASLLSRFRRTEKEALTGGIVAKAGPRDLAQVVANGGVYTACLVVAALCPPSIAAIVRQCALGALATSSSDTWATEVGTLYGGTPRSMFTLRPVARGMSGGVTAIGSAAMVAGAAFVALVAMLLGLTSMAYAVTAGGVAGAVADSALGATAQERRWCPTCSMASEQVVHTCGSTTSRAGGAAWIDNDAVNLLSTVVGGAVAALLASL